MPGCTGSPAGPGHGPLGKPKPFICLKKTKASAEDNGGIIRARRPMMAPHAGLARIRCMTSMRGGKKRKPGEHAACPRRKVSG